MTARIIDLNHETEVITMNDLVQEVKKSSHLDECGAIFTFEGIVRGSDPSKTTRDLTLTTPNRVKTEKELEKIMSEVKNKHGVKEISVVHYLGIFQPGDSLFLAVVLGPHRHETRSALEEIIERVKFELDFKKEEKGSSGTNIIMSGG